MSAASDAPEDERTARRLPVGEGAPLVLQVSPLDSSSQGQDEFFYDPFADPELGDFAAARAFFIHHGHVVVFHDCPDAIAFQELFPHAVIQYISSLPSDLLGEGYELLDSQRALLRSPPGGGQPLPVTPPRSLVDQYLARRFITSREAPPGSTTTSGSSTSRSPPPSLGSARRDSASRTAAARSSTHRPDPDGDDAPSVVYYGGARSSYGGSLSRPGGLDNRFGYRHGGSYRDSRFLAYGAPLRSPRGFHTIPSYVQHQHHPILPAPPPRVPDAAASVASSLIESVAPLGSLQHSDAPPPLASSVTMSLVGGGFPTSGLMGGEVHDVLLSGASSFTTPPTVHHTAPSLLASVALPATVASAAVVPPSVGGLLPRGVTLPSVVPPALGGGVPLPLPTTAPVPRAELLKLDPLKDPKSFIDSLEQIQFYLRMPEFSPGTVDGVLATSLSNQEASRAWEGALRAAVKDGTLRFLFENKGSQYHGRGFEMLSALMQHCRPDTVSNAFTSLLSMFNDIQGDSESIIEFRSRFDGLNLELSRCKVFLPPILLVMLFLRALHSRYSALFDQYRTRFKPIESASLDSIVAEVTYHDGFTPVDYSKKKPSSGAPPPRGPAAASANTNSDRNGKVWQSPFEWLAVYGEKGIKTRWSRAMAGTGICPICHKDVTPKHLPTQCPLLAELNLKLISVGGSGQSAPVASPAPAATPTGQSAAAATPPPAPGGGSSSAPSGLSAVLASAPSAADFESDEEYHWDGDEFGSDYTPPSKLTGRVAPYFPSCSHVCVVPSISATSVLPSPSPISLPATLPSLLQRLANSPLVAPITTDRLAVADTGATDHMVPDKSCFISYKSVAGLSVRMGNNSFVPVLGRGTAIFALNGKRILVRNVLHVPGLAVPLYSLRTHVTQRGCGFFGTQESGFLVYFPTFVLQVDTAVDCHLSFAPLGHAAPLHSLHYVQPRCAPTSYPTATVPAPAMSTATPSLSGPALINDDDTTVDNGDDDALPPLVDEPLTYSLPLPKVSGSLPSPSTWDPSAISRQLKHLVSAVDRLTSTPPSSAAPSAPDCPTVSPSTPSPIPATPALNGDDDSSSRLLSTMTPEEVAALIHHEGSSFPSVRPCDTANGSDTKTHWSSEELHRIMGCRKFRNYKHILQVSRDGEWVDGGEFPLSFGTYATIPKSNRSGLLDKTKYKYLDAVHMDIAFGDCVGVGGFQYALILVDRATRYNWAFGLKGLSSSDILSAIRKFRAAAGSLARCFYCDCDRKLFGSAISEYLVDNSSNIVAAPAKRQSSNGLVESHWKTMVHMARAYITEKQMPRSFWFYAIVHAARMMNAIPGRHSGRLVSPFLLVHGVGHDERTWIPIFSLAYFHHDRDGDTTRSHHQAHTMDGIVVGRSPTSNALLVYNPRNKKYYEPDSYRLDPYRLPGSAYPSLKYDGGLFVNLLRDDNPQFEEKYPPGTRVERLDPVSNMLLSGTVMDIPFPQKVSSPDEDFSYTILFDNGTSASVPLREMSNLIPHPPITSSPADDETSLLPPFLQLNSKITYEHEGQFHKGYLGQKDGVYRFSSKSHVNKRKEDWGVPLPNLPSSWVNLCVEGILIPGHVAHSFLRSTSSPGATTFDPVASFVSAVNLHRDCPPSLLKALAANHPDREVWLESFYEEKRGIEDLDTYTKISLADYRNLRENGAPRAIPTMCVLTIKKDENLRPLRAKSRIVVLGNHEERVWKKSEKFAPVLRQDSLRFLTSMAVASRRPLRQGDCKNAFCQGILPPDEVTIVRPPSGDPDAAPDEYWLLKRTLYGLRRSPRHWFDKISAILRSIGLRPSLEDPCLYTGFIVDPSNPSAAPSSSPLSLGMYVDDFVYFSADPAVEDLFCRLLRERCKVDFMGIVEWFLGVHFSWRITPASVDVHMNQSGFATNLVESFARQERDRTPTATPYRSGVPIDSIAPSIDAPDSPAQLRRKEAYQSLVGSIGWLASTTRPDIAAAHSFLSSYTNQPAVGHMKAALYVLHYIHSTHDYGISFTSKDTAPMHSYVHFPPSSDAEAYDDAIPPKLGCSNTISAYSDACWGSQLGSSVADGTLLPLFKFRSMSGGIVFKNGGPIGWLGERQDRTSLSSCEAEIRATNATSKKVVDFRNLSRSVSDAGYIIPDVDAPTLIYNDNDACVKWSYNMTSKAARHIELRENSVREWVQDRTIDVEHVSGKINPADIFTKEMRDGAHFRRLRDSFMSRLSDFLNDSILVVHHASQRAPTSVTPAAAPSRTVGTSSGYFTALSSSSLFRNLENISHLCSAGRHLLRRFHGFVPAHLF